MIHYTAVLDVPRHVVERLSALLAAHRRQIITPRRSRCLGTYRQAMFVLAWFRDETRMLTLAASFGLSQSTAYRYKDEGIKVLAAQAPELHEVLAKAKADGVSHLILDGSLFESDRVQGQTEDGNDLWYSGKDKDFGANIQGLANPRGDLLWVSDALPGSVNDITAARELGILDQLYPLAAQGLVTLCDSGYQGAGIGIKTPVKRRKGGGKLAVDNRTYNKLQRGMRAPGERMFASLKERFKALRHITISPNRIGDLVRAGLVLHLIWENG